MPGRTLTFRGAPSVRDPRWGQVAALASFAVLGQTWLHWRVSGLEIALAVITCVTADVAAHAWRRQELIVPLSGLITGLGLAMLVRSAYPVVFVIAGLLAIGSKHLITVNGHHRFNPSNFGLVVTLAFTQGGIADVAMGQWGRSGLILFAVIGAGSLVVFRAQRLRLSALYLGSTLLLAPLFHGGHLDLAVTMSGDVLAFAFFTITDPQTAPKTWRGQAVFAPVLAFVGLLFDSFGSMAGIFVAAFVIALTKPLGQAAWRQVQSRRGRRVGAGVQLAPPARSNGAHVPTRSPVEDLLGHGHR